MLLANQLIRFIRGTCQSSLTNYIACIQGCRFVSVVGGDDRCQNIFGNGSKQPRGRSVWQVAPHPQARSQDFILGGGGGNEHAKRAP